MSNKNKVLKELNSQMDAIKASMKQLEYIPIDEISSSFPVVKWSHWLRIEAEMPYSFDLIEKFKKFMAEEFPEWKLGDMRSYINDTEEGKIPTASAYISCWHYPKDDVIHSVSFEAIFRTEMKGSTCVLNPIGTEMKKVVLYETVCSQEAANEF